MYGKGGQTRGFLHIKDTVRCIEIAAENPADHGEFRVFNQFTEEFSVGDLANKVQNVAQQEGYQVNISNLDNPRVELEDHFFHAENTKLKDLGLEPHLLDDEVIREILKTVENHKDRVIEANILPKVTWK